MSIEELEDIYQDTALALLDHTYESPEHLRNALWVGMRYRALHAYRDERRHSRIWMRAFPGLQALADAKAQEQSAEPLALAREDQRLATEFLATLNDQEQEVYWLMTEEGWGHISIAAALGIPANQARNTMNACEHKRARFQTLYDAGRLCGYRAQTIQALEEGVASTEALARQALAHLQNCPRCHTAHSKLARNLHQAFQRRALNRQIAVLLPTPVLTHELGWLQRIAVHARSRPGRLNLIQRLPGTRGSAGERAAALLASSGGSDTAAKAAKGIALLAILATSTLGIRHLTHHSTNPQQHPNRQAEILTGTQIPRLYFAAAPGGPQLLAGPRGHGYPRQKQPVWPFGPGYVITPSHPRRHVPAHMDSYEPGGFAYLGLPSPPRPHLAEEQTERPGGGGEFSP